MSDTPRHTAAARQQDLTAFGEMQRLMRLGRPEQDTPLDRELEALDQEGREAWLAAGKDALDRTEGGD